MELSCDNGIAVIWQGSAMSGQCPSDTVSENNTITVLLAASTVGDTTTCGNFTSNVTDLSPGVIMGTQIVTASLTFVADVSLNDTIVQCEDNEPTNTLEINQLLHLPGTNLWCMYSCFCMTTTLIQQPPPQH